MASGLTIDVKERGAHVIDRLADITKRRTEEVLSDALRVYLWVLREQAQGRRVASLNGQEQALEPLVTDMALRSEILLALRRHERHLQRLVKDEKTAHSYFSDELRW